MDTIASTGVNSLAFAFADPTLVAAAADCNKPTNCLSSSYYSMITSVFAAGSSALTALRANTAPVANSKPTILISFGGEAYGGAAWDSLFSSSNSAAAAQLGTKCAQLAVAVATALNNVVYVGIDLDIEGMSTTLPSLPAFITAFRSLVSYDVVPLQLCTLSGLASTGSTDHFKVAIMQSYGPAQRGINYLNMMVNNVDSSCELMSSYWRAPALDFLPATNKVLGIWGTNFPTLLLHEPGCLTTTQLIPWMKQNAANIGIW